MKLIKVMAAAVLALALTSCGVEQKMQLACVDADGDVAFVSPVVGYIYHDKGFYMWDSTDGARYRYVQPQGWLCACISQTANKPVEATL